MSGCYSFYLVSKWLLLYVLRSANLWRGFRGQRAMESVVLVGKYEGCLSEKNSTKNTIWYYKKVLIKSYRSMYLNSVIGTSSQTSNFPWT